MSELTIRSSNIEALHRIADLVKLFGLEIVSFTNTNNSTVAAKAEIPIEFAEEPNVLALADIRKARLSILKEAANDPLFQADVAEVMEDFKFIDALCLQLGIIQK